MLTTKILSVLLLAASSACAQHNHLHKRDLVTTTVEQVVTVYVDDDVSSTTTDSVSSVTSSSTTLTSSSSSSSTTEVAPTSSSSSASASSSSSSSSAAATTATAEVQEKQVQYSSSDASPSSSSAAAASSSASSDSDSDSSSSGSVSVSSGSSGFAGITYSPYSSTGGCKTLDQVKSDFKKLSGFNVIRVYAVDCDQVVNVLKAKSSSQKVFAGLFTMSTIATDIAKLSAQVKEGGSWDDIMTVSVGNELVNGGSYSASAMAGYVKVAKAALRLAGYKGKVTTVDTFKAYEDNKALCTAGDYITMNAHAFFDSTVSADGAGSWLSDTIEAVAKACGVDKSTILVTESGWPSQGSSNGKAVPSSSNQASAYSSIKSSAGSQTFAFTAFNDYWKDAGNFGVEKYFGILGDSK